MVTVDEMIAANDLDELLREVDRCCSRRAWDELDLVRRKARQAIDTGRQLWPAASHAEYRLALEGPPEWAASVVRESAGHLALGPLAEVAASTHSWGELEPHLAPGPLRGVVAQERIVRGENLCATAGLGDLEVPLRLTPWEPRYVVAEYTPEKVSTPRPGPDGGAETAVDASPSTAVRRSAEVVALEEVTRVWSASSNGRTRAVEVTGGADDAVAALCQTDRAVLRTVDLGTVMGDLAWAAASGGAHGRRRGMAFGRSTAWWTVAVLTGLDDSWPADPDHLHEAASELEWVQWWPDEPSAGWWCRIAVADPADGLAWALDARDHQDDDSEAS